MCLWEPLLGVQNFEELDGQLSRMQKSKETMSKAIESAAEAVAFLKKEFGDRLGGEVADQSGVEFVTKAWDEFKEREEKSRQNFLQATDKTIRELERSPPQVCYMKCELKPSNYSALYQWVAVNESKSAEQEKSKKELERSMQDAHDSFEKERDFWFRKLSVEQLPVSQLLKEGMQEDRRLAGDVLTYQEAKDAYVALNKERAEQEQLETKYTKERKVVFEEMEKKAGVRSDMHDNIQQAVLNCQKAEKVVKRSSGKEQEKAKKDLEKARTDLAKARDALRTADAQLQTTMIPISGLVRDFPELSKGLDGFAACLPYELMDYWGGCRTLDEFNEFHLIPGEHRNKTFKATAYNGEIFAVKEYMLTGPMDACAREAALLVRLQHQHVVRVVSVFIDSKCTCLYMQMPFYQEGSMDVWIKDKGPHEKDIRKACYQALLALQHLHALHVVHSDIKPQNILIDRDYNAYLGDLDISVDMAGRRCSTQRIKATRNAVGFTHGFDAPEIMDGATKKTDMFAFGMTLKVLDDYSDAVKEAKGAQRDSLWKKLTDVAHKKRPSASECLNDPFFEACIDRQPPESTAVCVVCYGQHKLSEGVVCGHSHFVCDEDLDSFVAAELSWLEEDDEALARHRSKELKGMLPCPRCKIEDAQDESCQYDVQTLARHLRKDTFQRLQAAEDDKKAVEIWNQHQAEFSKKLQEIAAEYEKQESFRLAQLNEEATKAFLVKTMPNALQCPQCGLGPVDLKGCDDLRAHHGESVYSGGKIVSYVSNACRNCGFRGTRKSDWHKWDGTFRR